MAVIDMTVIMILGVFWFGVPFMGSLWQFALLSLIFIISGMGLGLLISVISKNQNQAVQYVTVFNLFSMILTGFILLGALFYYFPGFEKNLFLSVVGTFAMVFGLFSIMLGFYRFDEQGNENNPANIMCTTSKYSERK